MNEATFRVALNGSREVLSVSEGVTNLLGFAPEEFLSSRVQLKDRIHLHDADVVSQLFCGDVGLGCGSFHIRIRAADGRIRCARGYATKEIDSAASLILNLVLQDARSLPRTPDNRHVSIGLMSLMQSVDECVHLIDENYVVVAANSHLRMAFSDFAEQPRELIGLSEYDFLSEEEADISYGLAKQVFSGSPWAHQAHEFIDRHGKQEWIDLRKYPVKDETGKVFRILGIARVVTDRVLAEQTLIETTRSLQESQRIAGIGTYLLDIGTQTWTSSDVLDEIFGIDALKKHSVDDWISLIYSDDREMMIAHLSKDVLGDRQVFNREYRIVRKSDGAVRWVHGRGRLESDSKGNPIAMRGTIQDVTGLKQTELALRESRELSELFIEHAPAALAMFDRDMRYLAANRLWLEMHELVGRPITGRSHYEILPETPMQWQDEHQRALSGESVPQSETRLPTTNGSFRWVRRKVRPWRKGDGAIGGIVIIAEDTTERKKSEERLQLAANVFTFASEGITITDATGTILDVNDAFTRITGYRRDEVIGQNPRLLNSGRQSREFYAKMWRDLIENGHWSGEIWNRAKDGRVFPEMLTISAVRDASGQTKQYVALFSDLTSVKEQEHQLEKITHFDFLTGLPNRLLFADRLRQAMIQAHLREKPMMLVSLDLDDFKAVNDKYGHGVGDRLLTALAKRMNAALYDGDMLARLGGDEFAALFLCLDGHDDNLVKLATLLKTASEPIQVDGLVLSLSLSAGATVYPEDGDVDEEVLLRQANQAMYRAKLEGKNRYHVFDPWLDRNTPGQNEEIERVRRGLESNEFALFYQPKVNMSTGAVIGVEALMRWQHPERGLLGPSQFLPLIEGHPVAIQLGEFAIDTALTQIEEWRRSGLVLRVSVNVAAQQLEQTGFVEKLAKLLAAHRGVEPSSLELEVLESSALNDLAQVTDVMRACRRLGVTFALDDFGTGYSSLTYLKRLPVSALKIDQTFVRNMLDHSEDLKILEGVLGLAGAFNHLAIAEGVETVEHGLLLLRFGCQFAQGFGIARPMPASDIPDWVATWHPDPRWVGVSPLDPIHRPMLHACAEHNSWVETIRTFIEGEGGPLPTLDVHSCRLASWMSNLEEHDWLETSQQIALRHQQLHVTADNILALKADRRDLEAKKHLQKLYDLRDTLRGDLESLLDEIERRLVFSAQGALQDQQRSA